MKAMAMLVIATVNSSTYQKCTEQCNATVFSPNTGLNDIPETKTNIWIRYISTNL